MGVGGKDMSQGMGFERDHLPITRFKHESMTEKAHTGSHRPICQMAVVHLKQIRTCRKAMGSAIVWIERHTGEASAKLKLIMIFQELKGFLEIALRFSSEL